MPKKSWICDFEDLEIEFRNFWTWSGEVREKLIVNGELVMERICYDDDDTIGVKERMKCDMQVEYKHNGKTYKIRIIGGSKWYLAIGIHIYINDELVGGDVKSRLFFTGKRQ